MVGVLNHLWVLGMGVSFGGSGALVLCVGYEFVQPRVLLHGAGVLAGTGSKAPGSFESEFAGRP
jgi:hypothetical protein